MSQAPVMPVFTDALIGDTTHLSTEEFGAYCLILFATWRNSCEAFADDPRMARICRVSETRWKRKIRPALVSFFDLSDGNWRQKRLEKEWNFVAERHRINRENGKQGGRPKSLNNNDPNKPNGSLRVNPERNQELNPDESPLNHTHKNTPQTPQGGPSRKVRGEASAEMPIEPWPQRCAGWVKSGFWPASAGPPPDDPACYAPPDLVADARQRRKRAA